MVNQGEVKAWVFACLNKACNQFNNVGNAREYVKRLIMDELTRRGTHGKPSQRLVLILGRSPMPECCEGFTEALQTNDRENPVYRAVLDSVMMWK